MTMKPLRGINGDDATEIALIAMAYGIALGVIIGYVLRGAWG